MIPDIFLVGRFDLLFIYWCCILYDNDWEINVRRQNTNNINTKVPLSQTWHIYVPLTIQCLGKCCISQIWPSSTGHQYTGPFRYLKWTVLLTVLLTVSRDRKARFWIKEELESRVLKYSMVGERDLLHLSVINIVYYDVDALPYLPKSSSLRHILIYEWFELLWLEASKTLYICGCRLTLWPPFFNVL